MWLREEQYDKFDTFVLYHLLENVKIAIQCRRVHRSVPGKIGLRKARSVLHQGAHGGQVTATCIGVNKSLSRDKIFPRHC